MNATGKTLLAGMLAAAGATQAGVCHAGYGAVWSSAAHAMLGQVTPGGPSAPPAAEPAPPTNRQEVDALLAQARRLLAAGQIDQADRLVRRAEAARVSYPMFYSGDRPARLRRLVDQARRDAPAPDPFLAQGGLRPPNPFQAGAAATPRALPAVDQPNAAASGQPSPLPPVQQAEQLMAAARAAMQLGNLPQAEQYAAR
ncbi:MAG: hypothetical protein AAF790_15455, partial [Planctomycetota bacterium]